MTYTSYKSCSAIPDIVTLYMIEFICIYTIAFLQPKLNTQLTFIKITAQPYI